LCCSAWATPGRGRQASRYICKAVFPHRGGDRFDSRNVVDERGRSPEDEARSRGPSPTDGRKLHSSGLIGRRRCVGRDRETTVVPPEEARPLLQAVTVSPQTLLYLFLRQTPGLGYTTRATGLHGTGGRPLRPPRLGRRIEGPEADVRSTSPTLRPASVKSRFGRAYKERSRRPFTSGGLGARSATTFTANLAKTCRTRPALRWPDRPALGAVPPRVRRPPAQLEAGGLRSSTSNILQLPPRLLGCWGFREPPANRRCARSRGRPQRRCRGRPYRRVYLAAYAVALRNLGPAPRRGPHRFEAAADSPGRASAAAGVLRS